MKSWIKSWIYHKCLKVVLHICRKDPFYASMLIAEVEVLRVDMRIPPQLLDAAEHFIVAARRDLRG